MVVGLLEVALLRRIDDERRSECGSRPVHRWSSIRSTRIGLREVGANLRHPFGCRGVVKYDPLIATSSSMFCWAALSAEARMPSGNGLAVGERQDRSSPDS